MTASSTPVRVAIDVGPLYGHRTGIGVAVDGLVSALSRSPDVALDPFLVSVRSKPHSGHRRLPLPGIVASHLWSRLDRPRADHWMGVADVVHGTNYVAPPTSRPTVLSVYDCWFLRHPEQASPVVRRAGDRLRRAVAAGAWLHSSSQDTTTQARDLLGTERVVTISLGPPPALPQPDDHAMRSWSQWLGGAPFVFAIGTEERRKDLPLLVEAFGILGQRRDAKLILAGAMGDATEEVEASVDRLPPAVADRVERVGAIDDAQKHWFLQHAAALAVPSLDEGFGYPILEANRAGVPVVARQVGSVAEIAGGAALLVAERDPRSFADALARAIDDAALRATLIDAGHRNVDRFSWTDTAAQLVTLYRRAIEEGR